MSENNNFLLNKNIKFWSFLIVLIPSIFCSLFNLYYFIFDRTLRNTLNNHVIIIILLIGLFCQITIYPWMLYYYSFDGIWQRSIIFCSIWVFIDWTFYIMQTILFAWATIERHILVFHDRWLSTKKKRFFFHYLPLIILISYCLIFYLIVNFLSQCENIFNMYDMRCMYFCIINDYIYFIWDTVIHQLFSGLIILIFSIALLLRVIRKKIHMHQPVHWRKHRKITIQLLSISFVYLLFYFPYTCSNFMYLCMNIPILDSYVVDFVEFFSYFMMLFLPFVCTLTIPNLNQRINRILRSRRVLRAIGPATI